MPCAFTMTGEYPIGRIQIDLAGSGIDGDQLIIRLENNPKASLRYSDVPGDTDLRPFSVFLWQQGVAHRISEERGEQVLWLVDDNDARRVQQWFEDWRSGLLQLEAVAVRPAGGRTGVARDRWRYELKAFPVVFLFMLACIAVGIWTDLGQNTLAVIQLTLLKPVLQGNMLGFEPLAQTLTSGQWWRLFTPTLLHFGWAHIIFNMLWLYELGKRLERVHGHLFLGAFIVLTGVVSNLVQYQFGGGGEAALFGGFSGVVYALLGFIWRYQALKPVAEYHLPPGIIWFMLLWLVIGYLGVLDAWVLMANAAHTGGLLIGMLWGTLAGWYGRQANA